MAVDVRSRTVIVGCIVDAFGVKGQVKVRSFTEQPDSLVEYRHWLVSGSCRFTKLYNVFNARFDGRYVIATLEGISNRDQALELKGSQVEVDRRLLPALESDQIYWIDLIGLTVRSSTGDKFGTVINLMETGANDVLVVQGETECLIPYVSDVVLSVDLDKNEIVVDWSLAFDSK